MRTSLLGLLTWCVVSWVAAAEVDSQSDLRAWKVEGRQERQSAAVAGLLIRDASSPRFYKNEPGAAPQGTIHRTIKLAGLREIRVRFTLDDPPLAGFGVQLSANKSRYGVVAAEEGRFVLHAQPPFYGGPSWRPGQAYEIRVALKDGKMLTSIAEANRLPVPVERYTRPLPQAWRDAGEVTIRIGFLSRQRPDRGDAAGTARLLAVRWYDADDTIPRDVEISATPVESLAKSDRLRRGALTPALANWVARQREQDAVVRLPVRFEVQAWDAAKLGRLRGWDQAALDDIASYYTLLQFRGSPPAAPLLDAMAGRDLRLASYLSTRQPPYFAALSDSPHALTNVLIKGQPQPRSNRFNGDLVELAAWQTLVALEPARQSGILARVMLDSEHKTGIGQDPLAAAAAKQAGLTQLFVAPPAAPKPYQQIVADDDPRWRSLAWYFRNHHTDNDFHRPIANAIHSVWPGVEVTTDPILDYGSTEQFAGLDAVQHWIRVHYAPRNPRSVAYYCERAQAHVRRGKGMPRIVIGPQLGRGERATPADMLSEACWLAVAFGAKGITHWGQQAVWQEGGEFSPGGAAAWERMKRLKAELYDPHGRLLLAWKPRPRRVAMLFSLVDLAYGSGSRHTGREACENMYRSLLSLGEPVDVIYDQEVLAGRLQQYRVLVVPSLYVANRTLVEQISDFAQRGGTVITHDGSVLSDIDGVAVLNEKLTPLYRDYAITKGEPTLLPHQYAEFLTGLAGSVRAKLPFTPQVELARADVIANLMEARDATYLVLVNDRRRYGPEVKALGKQYMLDQGVPNRIVFRMASAKQLKDIGTGRRIHPNQDGRFATTLEPGWGAIFRVEPNAPRSP